MKYLLFLFVFFFFYFQVTQQVFVAEEWVKNARGETRVALDARAEVEVELGTLKENHAKMAEQLKEAVWARDNVEVGLRTTKRQFEEVRKNLHYTEKNLAMEK